MTDEHQPDHPPNVLDLLTSATEDYQLVMIPFFAAVIAEDMPDRLREMRFSALREMSGYLHQYKTHGYTQKLLCAIARKKGEKIMSITNKADMQKLLKPRCPHFDGNKFVSDPLVIPEEELICWNETGLRGPLVEPAYKRCMELFCQIFPDQYEQVFGKERWE